MIGYVAKDRDGTIYLHTEKPTYETKYEGWFSSTEIFDITKVFPEFDTMSYTDEPIKVEIKLERI